jgi:drug/metabolite transporter (DMT)-like permease
MADLATGAALRTTLLTIALLFLLGVSFGVVYALNLTATANGVPFLAYVFWQSLGGAVILFVISVITRQLPGLGWRHLRVYAVTGALNMAIPYSLLSYVAPKVPSGVLSLGLTLVPVLVYLFALGLKLDRLRGSRVLGILLGLAGVLLVLVPRTSLPTAEMAGWVALGLVAPLCYAVNAVLIPLLSPPASQPAPLAFGLLALAAIYTGIAMVAAGDAWAFPAPFGAGGAATIGAMANDALSYFLVFEIIRRAGPVIFSTSNYVATFAGLGISVFWFGDALSYWIWAALLLMCAGLFLVNFTGRPAAPER